MGNIQKRVFVLFILAIALFALFFSIGVGGTTSSKTDQQQDKTTQQQDKAVEQNKTNESKAIKLKCDPSSYTTMSARIKCFLSLSDEDVKNVNYTPEECILKQSETDKNKCIEKYRLFQTCRPKPSTDKEREKCILPKLNISGSVRQEVEMCKSQQRQDLINICMSKIREKVLDMVKFRVYNLVYKAQELKGLGVPEDKVISILEKVNNAKIALEKANSNDERIAILEGLKADWQAFSDDAKNYVKR
ncbi:MAG: hypothetical protein QXS91_00695 [Candidatus Anstonellales archaeon]